MIKNDGFLLIKKNEHTGTKYIHNKYIYKCYEVNGTHLERIADDDDEGILGNPNLHPLIISIPRGELQPLHIVLVQDREVVLVRVCHQADGRAAAASSAALVAGGMWRDPVLHEPEHGAAFLEVGLEARYHAEALEDHLHDQGVELDHLRAHAVQCLAVT